MVRQIKTMRLHTAAARVEAPVQDTLTYYGYPSRYWLKLKTNYPMERLLKEVRRRTKVVGAFPDGHAALMLVAARIRLPLMSSAGGMYRQPRGRHTNT